jgi:hypothetical protein
MPGPEALFVGEPQTARFVAGGLPEAEALFGSPLPILPPPEFEKGRGVYFIHTRTRLHALQRFSTCWPRSKSRRLSGRPAAARRARAGECEAALGRVLASARAGDRRLSWSTCSGRARGDRRDAERLGPPPQVRRPSARCTRRSATAAWAGGAPRAQDASTLVDAIVDDGLAFTEASIQTLDFNQFLPVNKRYRLRSASSSRSARPCCDAERRSASRSRAPEPPDPAHAATAQGSGRPARDREGHDERPRHDLPVRRRLERRLG